MSRISEGGTSGRIRGAVFSSCGKKNALLLTLIFLAATFGSASSLITEDEMRNQRVVNYNLTETTLGDFSKSRTAEAEVTYLDMARMRFKRPKARLTELLVKRDQSVKSGDVIAIFAVEQNLADFEAKELELKRNETSYMLSREENQGEIDVLREKLRMETDAYEREKLRLSIEKAAIQIEMRALSYEYEQNALDRAIADQAEEISDDRIVAPYDGTIRSVTLKRVGDSVNAGNEIAVMYSKDKFLLSVEDGLHQMRYNTKVLVQAGAESKAQTFKGTVVAADNVLPAELQTGRAYIALDDESVDGSTLTNIKVNYDIMELNDVLMVERRALDMERGIQFVSILEDGILKKRYVKIGSDNATYAWVLQGLTEGQSVIRK